MARRKAIPFKIPTSLPAAGIPPAALAQISRFIDVRSHTFKVTVTATLGSISHECNAILFRAGNGVQVVGFYLDQ